MRSSVCLRARGNYPSNPERPCRALTAPGSVSLVAVAEGDLAGVIQLQSDGEIQAHLATIVVAPEHRGSGIARAMLAAAPEQAEGSPDRLDLGCRWLLLSA